MITPVLSEYVLLKYHISTNRILRICFAKCLNKKQLMPSRNDYRSDFDVIVEA